MSENEVARIAPAQGYDVDLIRMLADPNITAEKMQVVLAARREILAERRNEAFQIAFIKAAADMPRINKNGLIELRRDGKILGTIKYAKWEDMDEGLRPHLQKFGLALTFAETPMTNGRIQLRGTLMHIDGGSISSERTMPPDIGPGRNSLQAEGSAVSYCKRYLAEELCNVVRIGVDDDGTRAVSKPITAEQAAELRTLIKKIKTKEETFLKLFLTDCKKIEEIPQRDFPRLINAASEKLRSMENKS